ncbi:MAG: amidase [Bacillota bacterium]
MSNPEEIVYMPAHKLAKLIKTKELSPVDVVQKFLSRIEEVNPKINAYCTVAADYALEEAKKAEKKILSCVPIGQLHGVPVAIKDVTLTKGIRTTFGSKLYKDFVPDINSLVVQRLKDAGAIVLGKTNTPEFAAGGSTYNDLFGATRTPWNTDYNSGGSSGGSAAAIAAGLCPIAEGNDLGGSLRIPASFCGIVGLRPSPGRVPLYPSDLYWDDMSVEGPMARTVNDVALMLDVIAGMDKRAPMAMLPREESFLERTRGNLDCSFRIAWGNNLNLTPVDEEVMGIARGAVEVFKLLGCPVSEDHPDFSGLQETAAVLRGVRFAALYHDQLKNPEFIEKVNPNIIGNIKQGLSLSGEDLAKAEKHRSELWSKMLDFFSGYDLLILPTVPVKPFPAETAFPTEINGKAMESYIDWIMLTYAFSVTGLPAVSIPCGWTDDGFPVGLQIAGRPGRERDVLLAAACYEQARPWHEKKPQL